MELVEELLAYKVSLDELLVGVRRTPKNETDARGLLAEALVEQWLHRCPGISLEQFPRESKQYILRQTAHSHEVTAYRQGTTRAVLEYDFLVRYHNTLVGVEVKSGKNHGAFSKANRARMIIKDVFNEDSLFLVFSPANGALHSHVQGKILWMDLGYNKKELQKALSSARYAPRQYVA